VDVAQLRQPVLEQRWVRGALEPLGEVEQVRPHQLRREDAIRRRAALERGWEGVAAVGGARVGRREQVEHAGVADVVEVLPRLPRQAGPPQALEGLLRLPRHAGALQEGAQQGAAAARRGTDEI
jgi:hypothetical protein